MSEHGGRLGSRAERRAGGGGARGDGARARGMADDRGRGLQAARYSDCMKFEDFVQSEYLAAAETGEFLKTNRLDIAAEFRVPDARPTVLPPYSTRILPFIC